MKSADILRELQVSGAVDRRSAERTPDRTRDRARHHEVRAAGPVPRRRRHQALQHPDARGRVHHRARRRPERARAREGRRDPDRAVAVRQDADHDVPRPPARAARRQLPAGRRGPRHRRPARGRSNRHARSASGSTTTPRGSARCATSDARTRGTASRSAPSSCVGPRTSTAAIACRSSTPRPSRSRRCPP